MKILNKKDREKYISKDKKYKINKNNLKMSTKIKSM